MPPWLTVEDAEKIAGRLAGIRKKMEAAGYLYDVLHASPDGRPTEFRERLRAERIDVILIGGCVDGGPKLASFKQQIIKTIRDEAPGAKVLEFATSKTL
jgi:hypothetical protein